MGQKKTKERRGGAGRNQGRKTTDGTRGLKPLTVTLDVESIERARRLGDGKSVSAFAKRSVLLAVVATPRNRGAVGLRDNRHL